MPPAVPCQPKRGAGGPHMASPCPILISRVVQEVIQAVNGGSPLLFPGRVCGQDLSTLSLEFDTPGLQCYNECRPLPTFGVSQCSVVKYIEQPHSSMLITFLRMQNQHIVRNLTADIESSAITVLFIRGMVVALEAPTCQNNLYYSGYTVLTE